VTGRTGGEGATLTPEALREAVDGLEQIRDVLQRAGRGASDAGEVRGALVGYWQEHGDALTACAVVVGGQVRSQLVAALLHWRTQLAQQRSSGVRSP
jgi:hypothetical protein